MTGYDGALASSQAVCIHVFWRSGFGGRAKVRAGILLLRHFKHNEQPLALNEFFN